jgi:hypothetical protein
MVNHVRDPIESAEREGRLNRRIAIAGVVATVSVGILSAIVTAHSAPVIKFLGGRPDLTPSSASSASGPVQLPSGPSFASGSFTISNNGIDLDRNPAENGNLSDGQSEFIAEYPTGLYFYGAQDAAQWTQPGVPTQAQCHHAELSDGTSDLNFDLTDVQQSKQQARFCVLTSEGRDAYLVVPGGTVTSNSPFPAQAFVWASKIPLN